MNSLEPTIRLARREDAPRCNDLYNKAYQRNRSTVQWEWEFCKPAPGVATIPLALAEVGDELVGTQALIPIQLIDRNGTYWTAKSEETLVSPSMRGRGLFKKLYAPLLDFARTHRLESIWGFTPARSAFEREGFSIPARTSQLLRAFTSGAAAGLQAPRRDRSAAKATEAIASTLLSVYGTLVSTLFAPGPKSIELKELDSAPDWADVFSHQFVADWGGTTLHRSTEYMQWRFFDNPYRKPIIVAAFAGGQPVGWVAFGLGSTGVAAIVDLIALRSAAGTSTEAVVGALIDTAARRARDMGATAIRAWDVTDHPFSALVRRVAKRVGWIRLSRGFDMVFKQTPGIEPRPCSDDISSWYITRAFTEGADI